ncbi:MAG TPA: DUF2784 domain-containing protein [Longimicrobiaceae bacterium]|nr:DUF2784 domain-containing protein [Longimicrobiaceae bacterium]
MSYRVLADVVLLVHLAFILFVVLGGVLVLRWRELVWLHVPAAVWGVLVELLHLSCPLTPLEDHLRRLGGEAGYSGGFVEHYVTSIVYPSGLTPRAQDVLGGFVLVVNALVYARFFRSRRRHPAR